MPVSVEIPSTMDPVLAAKAALGILGIPFLIGLSRSRLLGRISDSRFTLVAIGLALASRLGVYLAVYWGLAYEVPSDVIVHYYPQGRAALDGGLVYRDFASSYGPLFSYLAAGVLKLWDSIRALVLATIILESLSVLVWLAVARRLFEERLCRLACCLYLTSGHVVWTVSVLGQNQVWLSLALAVSWWLLLARRDFLSGLGFGLGLAAVKILGIVFLPFFWIASRQRLRWLLGALTLPVLAVVVLGGLGSDVSQPLRSELIRVSSGNLPYLLSGLGLRSGEAWGVLWAAISLAVLPLLVWRRRQSVTGSPRAALMLSVVGGLLFLVLSRKALTNYQVIFFFPLCLLAVTGSTLLRYVVAFGVFGLVSLLEPSLWFRWLELNYLDWAWQKGWMPRWQTATFAAVEVVLLGFYLGYARLGWRLTASPGVATE